MTLPPTSTRGPQDCQVGKGVHHGGSQGVGMGEDPRAGGHQSLGTLCTLPQLLIRDHSQTLTSLFFLQGLCLNEAKPFLTQATYLFKMP